MSRSVYKKFKDSRIQGVERPATKQTDKNAKNLKTIAEKDIAEIERILIVLIKSIENKHLNP